MIVLPDTDTPASGFLRNVLINLLGGATKKEETTAQEGGNKTADGKPVLNTRPVEGPGTLGPDAPPPRQAPIADAATTLVDRITDPVLRRQLLELEYEQIKKRDADIARYRLEGQQEVTRRQAQNNVINAWKEVEVKTIEKERDMALGLAEVAYRSSMPNPNTMQGLNNAAATAVNAFANRPSAIG